MTTTTKTTLSQLQAAMTDRLVEIGWAAAVATHPSVDGIDLGGISQDGMVAARDDRSGQHSWARKALSNVGRVVASEMLKAKGVGACPVGTGQAEWLASALAAISPAAK